MKNNNENLYRELKSLIEATNNTEKKCRAFLKHARDKLIDVTTETFIEEAEEYRGHLGDSDYLIICKCTNESRIEKNRAYLWETKAPQCHLFEADGNNRVRPTSDFISAENQLLHYFEESRGSNEFKAYFQIIETDDVKLGGIIIGSQNTLVRGGKYNEKERARLYLRALELRQKHLYGYSGIKIMTWDYHILEHLRPIVKLSQPVSQPVFTGAIGIQKSTYTTVSSG